MRSGATRPLVNSEALTDEDELFSSVDGEEEEWGLVVCVDVDVAIDDAESGVIFFCC